MENNIFDNNYTRDVINLIYNEIYNPTVAKKELVGWYLIQHESVSEACVVPDEDTLENFTEFVKTMNVLIKITNSNEWNGMSDEVKDYIINGTANLISHRNPGYSEDLHLFIEALTIYRFGCNSSMLKKAIINYPEYNQSMYILNQLRMFSLIDDGYYGRLRVEKKKHNEAVEKKAAIDKKREEIKDPELYTKRGKNPKVYKASDLKIFRDSIINGDDLNDVATVAELSIPTLRKAIGIYEKYETLPSYSEDPQYIKNLRTRQSVIAKSRKEKSDQPEVQSNTSVNSLVQEQAAFEKVSQKVKEESSKKEKKEINITSPMPIAKLAQMIHVNIDDILKVIDKNNRKYKRTSMLNLETVQTVTDKFGYKIGEIEKYKSPNS